MEQFQASVPNISTHLKAVHAEGEVADHATIKSYLIVQDETGGRCAGRLAPRVCRAPRP